VKSIVLSLILVLFSPCVNSDAFFEGRCGKKTQPSERRPALCSVPFGVMLARIDDLDQRILTVKGYLKRDEANVWYLYSSKSAHESGLYFDSVLITRGSEKRFKNSLEEHNGKFVVLDVRPRLDIKPFIETWAMVDIIVAPRAAPTRTELRRSLERGSWGGGGLQNR
jgi:hypothetical protein